MQFKHFHELCERNISSKTLLSHIGVKRLSSRVQDVQDLRPFKMACSSHWIAKKHRLLELHQPFSQLQARFEDFTRHTQPGAGGTVSA